MKIRALIIGVIAALALVAPVAAHHDNDNVKVWVCKYVGKPGDFETLKPGKQPITVSVNAADAFIGADFADGQTHSFVIDFQTEANTSDHGNTYTGDATCPKPEPTPSPSVEPTPTPTENPTPSPSPTVTPSDEPTPSPSTSPTASPEPSQQTTPTPPASETPSVKPSVSVTLPPTDTAQPSQPERPSDPGLIVFALFAVAFVAGAGYLRYSGDRERTVYRDK